MSEVLFQPIKSILPLTKLKNEAFERLGIVTVKDLLLYKPTYYKKRLIMPSLSSLKHHDEIIVKVKIKEIIWPTRKSSPVRMYAYNETGGITITFFNFHISLKKHFYIGAERIISGKVEIFDYRPQLSHPEVIWNVDNIRAYEPIYGLTYGITNSQLSSYIAKAAESIPLIIEWLPEKIIQHYELPSFNAAINSLHVLKSKECTVSDSHKRLKIDELFANQISLKLLRQERQQHKGHSFPIARELQEQVLTNLGFTLTEGQVEALNEIAIDQQSSEQMLRMLQGDVGCGKTLVALLSALNVLKAGGQVAIMAPTDILAQQHFQFFNKALNNLSINVALLTGRIKASQKNIILENVATGTANMVVGTHALFQEKVNFKDLLYIIVDEQHRFGVNQRLELINKGSNPDILIMSATPIPRSLTITLFGDMPVSKITSMPKGRQPIKTYNSPITKLESIAAELSKKINANEQVYWICPLIEAQETTEEQENIYNIGNVESRYQFLNAMYPNQVGLLHGKMAGDAKEAVMLQFKKGEIKILVSTTVVEVGVDVPEATIIIIENAERFGLAQLHQLRGRVGRGSLPSMCILLHDKNLSKTSYERLKIMRESNDGFYIAEQDLKLRGGGEILGQRQSGEQNFKFANLHEDSSYILSVNQAALEQDYNERVKMLLRLFDKDIDQVNLLS